jgi:ABC-type tungstate transport system permease subunit
MAGSDDLKDLLLNPAHVLVGANGLNKAVANEFVDWLTSEDGQRVIEEFQNNGVKLYSRAPVLKTAKL